jgi:hypothetical protein
MELSFEHKFPSSNALLLLLEKELRLFDHSQELVSTPKNDNVVHNYLNCGVNMSSQRPIPENARPEIRRLILISALYPTAERVKARYARVTCASVYK